MSEIGMTLTAYARKGEGYVVAAFNEDALKMILRQARVTDLSELPEELWRDLCQTAQPEALQYLTEEAQTGTEPDSPVVRQKAIYQSPQMGSMAFDSETTDAEVFRVVQDEAAQHIGELCNPQYNRVNVEVRLTPPPGAERSEIDPNDLESSLGRLIFSTTLEPSNLA